MAAGQRRELDMTEEDEFLKNVEGFGLQPYQFEPENNLDTPVHSWLITRLRVQIEHDLQSRGYSFRYGVGLLLMNY